LARQLISCENHQRDVSTGGILTAAAVDRLLAELAALLEPVEIHFRWRPQARDPSDEMVLEAAINGRADALVTYNVADFQSAGERLCHAPRIDDIRDPAVGEVGAIPCC
jgi:PIN domain